MMDAALPWFVLVTTGSVTRTGLVAFAEMTPYVLVGAVGGPFVDRVGPVRAAVAGNLAAALAVSIEHSARGRPVAQIRIRILSMLVPLQLFPTKTCKRRASLPWSALRTP